MSEEVSNETGRDKTRNACHADFATNFTTTPERVQKLDKLKTVARSAPALMRVC
ncbi:MULTISPECIES: hypothetical protein [Acetobacter]|uniref:hypothetical protein n=1 Tax=Acetobacter TaxID=434 RepID=UPI0012FE6F0A|nr:MULTISPECIES: hypothetical protein [Acetobacter]MBS0963319.1 hypothetical protein [Acetobacter persici]MBS0999433.1 hypothetical protein [Acetobacter persici]MBS1014883.1 hypothetical protein [Acetobacter persici]MCP9320446.1 hypothetical protein [Acetobacter persici]